MNSENQWKIRVLRSSIAKPSIALRLQDKIAAMYQQGVRTKDIARKLGIGKSTVYRSLQTDRGK
ncbi:helix-turn-helix domain-containing protein [Pseudorhizobium banfieldiae]|uniref:helix-turn-helix domain-containing protein n=1 Tax=Pseudorhizobium banfieldiae TaxID=1125847 RepID=UPI0009E291A6